jgi:ATP-dependent Clp protease ATP-binding subunit ClpX
VTVTLDLLDRDALVKILTEPKNALVKQYQKLLSFDGVNLEFDKAAIESIADKAIERKTGARGLRGIMEKIMTNIMYEVPSRDDVVQCIITRETVESEKDPELVLAEPELLQGKDSTAETA